MQEEDQKNQELLDLSRQILELTKELHAFETGRSAGAPPQHPGSPDLTQIVARGAVEVDAFTFG